MGLMGAVVGVLVAAGVALVVSGFRGVEVREKTPTVKKVRTSSTPTKIIVKQVGFAVVLLLLFWWLTGWPMAGLSAAAIALVVPKLQAAQRQREAQLDRAEDLARWCEMVRDSMRSGSGLKDAIDATAQPQVSGVTIRMPVRLLSDRCEAMPISKALRLFADDVSDPICDQIVLSLVMVEEQGGKELVPVLSEIVGSVRRRASMRRRIETGRARTYAATRGMVGMTILLASLMTIFASSFMKPFDGFVGQFWMGVVGASFTAAVWAMIPLSRPEPDPRLLANLNETAVAA
jgi:Flp pilus assembly protein TadB